MGAVPIGLVAVVGAAVVVGGLVLALVFGLRAQHRKRDDWHELAARRGLVFVDGDPFDLPYAAHGRVSMTLHAPAGGPRFALVGVWPTGSDLGTVPAVVAWVADLPGPVPTDSRRWSVYDHPQHGRLATLAAHQRLRGGGTAPAAEAEALLDEFLRAVRP